MNSFIERDVLYGMASRSGVELQGTKDSLIVLSSAVASPPAEMLLNVTTHVKLAPAEYFLKKLITDFSHEKVLIVVEDGILRISGDVQPRLALASNIRSFANKLIPGGSRHIHIEYFPVTCTFFHRPSHS